MAVDTPNFTIKDGDAVVKTLSPNVTYLFHAYVKNQEFFLGDVALYAATDYQQKNPRFLTPDCGSKSDATTCKYERLTSHEKLENDVKVFNIQIDPIPESALSFGQAMIVVRYSYTESTIGTSATFLLNTDPTGSNKSFMILPRTGDTTSAADTTSSAATSITQLSDSSSSTPLPTDLTSKNSESSSTTSKADSDPENSTESTATGSVDAKNPSGDPSLVAPSNTLSDKGSNTTSPATSGSSSSGLPAGAKGGIGAGATVAVIALLALIFFMMRRRKKRTRASPGGYHAYVGEDIGMGDLREKEVGVAAIPMNSSSPASAHGDDTIVSPLTRSGTNRSLHAQLNGNSVSRNRAVPIVRDTEPVTRKPVGVGDGEEPLKERQGGRNSVPKQSHVLNEDERARWEEEERRLDADIAEAERRGRLI